MPPSIFLSLHPFFEGGPINGRKQANAGFMRALLELDPFDRYQFFVDNPRDLEEFWARQAGLAALRRGAVTAHRRVDLLAALHSTAFTLCHLSDPIDDFVLLAAARNRLSADLFPLTAPNHTLSYARYASSFQGYIWDGWGPRDVLGCNSSAARAVLGRCFEALNGPGYRLPALEVMHMGADLRIASRDADLRSRMRPQLGLGDDSVLLLLFGRMTTVDKMDPLPLLLAMRRARELCPQQDIALAVSGAAPDSDPVFAIVPILAQRFGLTVHMLPNPTEEQRDALFAAADIFVSPSDNIQETFGLTLVEAFAAGLPVIASDWDGYRDIVEHMVTGLLVPTLAPADTPLLDMQTMLLFDNQYHLLRGQSTCVDVPALAEAIALLAGDSTLRRRMGAAGRERAQRHFSWNAAVQRWVALWAELCSRPVDSATEDRMRAARHPRFLPFGAMFAPFASGHLADDDRLSLTGMGSLLLHRELPWESFAAFRFGFPEEDIRPLLVRARKPVAVRQLREGSRLDAELFERYALWCLKHDLLARVPADSSAG
ncbi:MAG: glycosyltransferase family 4 protein [Desulfovibrio desulfuricans]|jgi:glycosyltransferase involved in cell wall biosynthesis|nr:glycosyltransferase family 4 protein [Desulfovibrio desulfuricans]